MVWLVIFLSLNIACVVFAALGSIRGRLWLAVAAVAAILYVSIAPLLAAIPPYLRLPLASTLGDHGFIVPITVLVLSVAGAVGCFRAASQREGSALHKPTQQAAFSFLGLAIFDGAVLVIVLIAHLLVSRDDF